MIHAVIIEMKPNPTFGFDGQPDHPFDSRWTYVGDVGTNKWGHPAYLIMIDKNLLDDLRDADPCVAEGWDWHLVDLGL